MSVASYVRNRLGSSYCITWFITSVRRYVYGNGIVCLIEVDTRRANETRAVPQRFRSVSWIKSHPCSPLYPPNLGFIPGTLPSTIRVCLLISSSLITTDISLDPYARPGSGASNQCCCSGYAQNTTLLLFRGGRASLVTHRLAGLSSLQLHRYAWPVLGFVFAPVRCVRGSRQREQDLL